MRCDQNRLNIAATVTVVDALTATVVSGGASVYVRFSACVCRHLDVDRLFANPVPYATRRRDC